MASTHCPAGLLSGGVCLFILLLVVVICPATALKCYDKTCNSREHTCKVSDTEVVDCEDDNNPWVERPCETDRSECNWYCHVKTFDTGLKIYGCTLTTEESYDEYKYCSFDGFTTRCICEGDLCNPGGGLTIDVQAPTDDQGGQGRSGTRRLLPKSGSAMVSTPSVILLLFPVAMSLSMWK